MKTKLLTASTLILNVFQFSQCFSTYEKENLIFSLNSELYIKHFNIIKDSEIQIDYSNLNFIKKLSQKNIFTCILSIDQMTILMNEHFKIYFGGYDYENLFRKTPSKIYPSKMMVWINSKNLGETLKRLFHVDVSTQKNPSVA